MIVAITFSMHITAPNTWVLANTSRQQRSQATELYTEFFKNQRTRWSKFLWGPEFARCECELRWSACGWFVGWLVSWLVGWLGWGGRGRSYEWTPKHVLYTYACSILCYLILCAQSDVLCRSFTYLHYFIFYIIMSIQSNLKYNTSYIGYSNKSIFNGYIYIISQFKFEEQIVLYLGCLRIKI